MKFRTHSFLLASSLLLAVPSAHAAVTATGNVNPFPFDPEFHYDLHVGESASGTLTVDGGSTLATGQAFIGTDESGIGVATVTGANSVWENDSQLRVGYYGDGTLNILAGGKVSNTYGTIGQYPDSTGSVTVTGASSLWENKFLLNVGSSGTGTLTINEGGKVTNTYGNIGVGLGSTGEVTVTGDGSQWLNSDELSVGNSSTGTLDIEDGGRVANTWGYIGWFPSGTGVATVTGDGSEWLNSNGLVVGLFGAGTLNIEDGGKVTSPSGYIGFDTSSTGVATVTGEGSQWLNSGGLYVGSSGTGTLNIEDGGKVTASYTVAGIQPDAKGEITVKGTGALLDTTGEVRVGDTDEGILNIQEGGTVRSKGVSISASSGGIGTATVTGAGSLWDNGAFGLTLTSTSGEGTLNISDGGRVIAAALQFTSNFSASDAEAVLNLSGTAASRGVLETGGLYEGIGTGVGGKINFNGGILRATTTEPNFIQNFEAGDVQIQPGGAFIDTEHNAVGYNVGISTVLEGSGGLTKQGSGTLTLSGANTYEGTTTVEKGTLALGAAGSIADSEEINVKTGAVLDVTEKEVSGGWTLAPAQTLSGGGTVSGLVVMESTSILSPGNSVGTIHHTGDAIWQDGSIYDWEIQDLAGAAGTGWDHYLLTGKLTLEGGFTLKMTTLGAGGSPGLLADWDPGVNDFWTILTAEGGIEDFIPGSVTFDVSAFAPSTDSAHFSVLQQGNSLELHYTADIAAVPEPGSAVTLALLLTSSIGLHRQRWKRS